MATIFHFTKPWDNAVAPKCFAQKSMLKQPVTPGFQRKRTLCYVDTEIMPPPELPIANLYQKPCFIPEGMCTEPIYYPNLVTGYDRNPQHAATAALNVRYTDKEWERGCKALSTEAIKTRMSCEQVRAESIRMMRETDETTFNGQTDVKYKIEERMKDIHFWRDELNNELNNVKVEAALLSQMKTDVSKSRQGLEASMHIAQECLRLREGRQGFEKDCDLIEESLLLEVNNLRNSRNRLNELYKTIDQQLNDLRSAQHDLQEDVVHKEQTLCIDGICKDLDNFSNEINYQDGIENSTVATTTAETWSAASARRVNISQAACEKAAQLRISLGTLVTGIAVSIQEHYANTNWAFERGQVKLTNEIARMRNHANAVKEEKFQIDKYVNLLKKALQDKSKPLMLSQSRLEKRCHREGLELCEDFAHRRLVKEVTDIQGSIGKLHEKLLETEAKYQQLLKTRDNLEADLRRKTDNLFTDREKCMSLRRSFPINRMVK